MGWPPELLQVQFQTHARENRRRLRRRRQRGVAEEGGLEREEEARTLGLSRARGNSNGWQASDFCEGGGFWADNGDDERFGAGSILSA